MLWKTMQSAWRMVRPEALAGRELASIRGIDPAIVPDLDVRLKRDDAGPYFVNCLGQRVPRDRIAALAAGIDRLLAEIRDRGDTIPDSPTPFRNPWNGKAFAISDLQLTGTTVDVNLTRRAGVVEIDAPVATAEQPLALSPETLASLAAALRRLLEMQTAAAAKPMI